MDFADPALVFAARAGWLDQQPTTDFCLFPVDIRETNVGWRNASAAISVQR